MAQIRITKIKKHGLFTFCATQLGLGRIAIKDLKAMIKEGRKIDYTYVGITEEEIDIFFERMERNKR